MSEYIYFIIYGFFVGVLAKVFYVEEDKGSVVLTILLGVSGSLLSSFLMKLLGFSFQKGFSLHGLVPAVLGALLILYLFSFIKKRFVH